MKLMSVYFVRFALLWVTVFFVTRVSYAEALLTGQTENIIKPVKTQVQTMGTAVGGIGNTTQVAKRPRAVQKISCWQNGELIFEQAVIAPEHKVNDQRLLHKVNESSDMLAFDFKSAFCFIK